MDVSQPSTSVWDIVSGYLDTDEESSEDEIQPSLPPVNVPSKPRRPTVAEAMEAERFSLRKKGEEELASKLYEKSSLINKHIGGAEVEVDYNLGLVGVKNFIIERCLRDFRMESDETSEDFEFFQDNWKVVTNAVIRMGNLDPEDFKSEIENYYMEAHNIIILEKVNSRRKIVDEMVAIRREKLLKESQEIAGKKQRIETGEDSSGDEALENELRADHLVQQKYEVEVRKKFENMGIRLPGHRVQEVVLNMISNLRIRSEQTTPERCSSPPRIQNLRINDSDEDSGNHCDNNSQSLSYLSFAYPNNEEEMDEFYKNDSDTDNDDRNNLSESTILKCESTHINNFNDEPKVLSDSDCFIGDMLQPRLVHEHSQAIFPENSYFGRRDQRYNYSYGIQSEPPSKKRIYCRDSWLTNKNCQDIIKEEVSDGNDRHQVFVRKGCIKKTKTIYPTDEDIYSMSVSERLSWRQCQELHSASKKSVRFVEFNDIHNICRFYSRPRDSDIAFNHAVDCAWPMTINLDLPLSKSVETFKILNENCGNSCSDYLVAERFYSRKFTNEQYKLYCQMRPIHFASPLVNKEDPSGVFLPAAIGTKSLTRKYVHAAEIQLRLMILRDGLKKCHERRAGMRKANHIGNRNEVVGVIITTDSLLESVNTIRLTNTLLQAFNTPNGIDAVVALLERCSYDDLDIRHYVLAWGHDAIVYQNANPIVAVTEAISGVLKLRAVFRKKYAFFDLQGYRRRNIPTFWLMTIPEIGHFRSEFKEFNGTIARLSSFIRSVRILDWAGAVKMLPPTNWSQFNSLAVEKRLCALFNLCRQELDVYYIRSDSQIKSERSDSYWNSKGYHGESHAVMRNI